VFRRIRYIAAHEGHEGYEAIGNFNGNPVVTSDAGQGNSIAIIAAPAPGPAGFVGNGTFGRCAWRRLPR
jgi:hypothetical protein